jgi:Tol biopolymer transport system component
MPLKLSRLLGTIIFTSLFPLVILFLMGLLLPSYALASRPDSPVITSKVSPPGGNLTGTATLIISTATPVPANLGKLAYLQEGDIWVKDLPDGHARQLTTGGHSREPRWSPSGR